MYTHILLLTLSIFAASLGENIMNIIRQSVNISQAAYCINDNNWSCDTCDQSAIYDTHIVKNGEQVIFGYIPEYASIFVGFRGSSNLENWLDNIQFSIIHPYSETSISVEKGFYTLFFDIKPDIYSILDRLVTKYNTHKLLITGHSLGGALATLMAFDVKYYSRTYSVYALITFGSPRVGDGEFSAKFNSFNVDSYRITHYYDMVPHVPQELLGYQHISNEIWFSETNTVYKVCNDIYNEDKSCSDSCAPTKCTSTSDHLNYLNISMGSSGMC